MKSDSRVKTLEELASIDSMIFFDTSVISHPIGKYYAYVDRKNLSKRVEYVSKNIIFLSEFIKSAADGANFFFTKPILDEIEGTEYYSYEEIQEKFSEDPNKELFNFRRSLFYQREAKLAIADLFYDLEKVVDIDNQDLIEKYGWIKDNLGISENDFNFVLSGLHFLEKGENVSLVSNDSGISDFWSILLHYEGLKKDNFKFFTRTDFFEFEEAYRNP